MGSNGDNWHWTQSWQDEDFIFLLLLFSTNYEARPSAESEEGGFGERGIWGERKHEMANLEGGRVY